MRVPQRETDFGSRGASSLHECLRRQFDLCSDLEILADSLPAKVDTRAATTLTRRIPVTLRRCHRMEEAIIFPILSMTDLAMHPILDRLRKEHLEDQDHACDVQEAVEAFVTDRTRRDAEELGYMLRCLFISLRRHLAFDRDHVLPLYRKNCML